MKMVKSNYFVLFMLALVFVMPGLAAYFFYQHPQWLGSEMTNKGELVTPAVLFAPIEGKPKWRLLLWNPTACETECLQQLDKLARIRLALGRRLYEVDEWLAVNDKTHLPTAAILNALREQDIHIRGLSHKEYQGLPLLGNKAKVFIINPNDYLVLAFSMNAKPADIFHDLKQLLNTTEKKNG